MTLFVFSLCFLELFDCDLCTSSYYCCPLVCNSHYLCYFVWFSKQSIPHLNVVSSLCGPKPSGENGYLYLFIKNNKVVLWRYFHDWFFFRLVLFAHDKQVAFVRKKCFIFVTAKCASVSSEITLPSNFREMASLLFLLLCFGEVQALVFFPVI